ncbi:MAG: hypothetical protein IH598_03205 [Bacteroidales bacterium]|nr:hypothetical protein [Bacteroidales bacterium]
MNKQTFIPVLKSSSGTGGPAGGLVRYAPEIILFIYVILFFTVKNPHHPNDRVIISDGKAYYAFITTAFIYHDLSYSFVEDYEAKYYPDHPSIFKEFRYKYKGETVNKGFPGLAFLLLPFFLIAHLLAIIFGLPADGYSLIYQYMMGFAALFYFWLGLRFIRKLLHAFDFDETVAAVILVLVAFATNIIYYTLKEGMMTHVYNFFLLAVFFSYLKNYLDTFRSRSIVLAALTYGLIVSTRPTNGLVILLVPFIAGSFAQLKVLFQKIFTNPKELVSVTLAVSVFPLITMAIWYLHSGYLVVWSYGEEGFNFFEPNFFNILFSFNRGWFIYTPLALLSLTGLVWLYRNQRFRFYWFTAFLVIFIYVASSWWVWTYTSNFGQRTFIDTYPIIALLLGYSWLLVKKNKLLQKAVIGLSVFLIALNSLQFYQHYTYVFPPSALTFDIYKDVFFRLKPKPMVYYPEGYITSRKVFFNDFEEDYGWLNYGSVTDKEAYKGKQSSQTGISSVYSIGLNENIESYLTTEYNRVRVGSWIYSDKKESSGVLVIELGAGGEQAFYQPFFAKEFSRKNKWSYMEVAIQVPDTIPRPDHLRVYFHNNDNEEQFFVDDLKVEVLSLSINY